MNRALQYFGGKKGYLISFVVLMGIYTLNYLTTIYQNIEALFQFPQIDNSIYIISIILIETFLVLSVISLWLCFKRKTFTIILSLLSLSFVINRTFTLFTYGFDYSTIISTIIGLLYPVSCITVIILLRLRAKKKIFIAPFMIISFVMMSRIVSLVTGYIVFTIEYGSESNTYFDIAGSIIYGIIPNLFLIAALIILWIPLEKSLICPKCGRRNNKTAGFCGGCGSPFK